MTALTVREAKNDLENVVQRVLTQADPTILTTDEGEQVILLSYAEYKSIQETDFLLSNPRTATELYQALEQVKQGQVVSIPLSSI
jgi:antitoxin YefM